MRYKKPNLFCYRLAQVVSWFAATFIFKRQIIRNELKGVKGPFVVIANHQAAYDFVNLIGMSCRTMTFVISNSFYNSMPLKRFFDKLGVIPKQQFQTSVKDMKMMKAVIDEGQPLVIYPAGLMCEDGLSTPIPAATYKFLKWLKADVYVARTSGTYFAMPKWADEIRPGKTYLDIYKLFDKDELEHMELDEVKEKTNEALLFDAYREQETFMAKFRNNDVIDGLENVLYMCPRCKTEFSTWIKNRTAICCNQCGYEEECDEYAFLHNEHTVGEELRYISDWSKIIFETQKQNIQCGIERELSAKTKISMIDYKKHKFVEVGRGVVSLSKDCFLLSGEINGEDLELSISIANIPTLPFSPGKYLELQHGNDIYRCALEDGKLVMKFINMLKAFYELNLAEEQMAVC